MQTYHAPYRWLPGISLLVLTGCGDSPVTTTESTADPTTGSTGTGSEPTTDVPTGPGGDTGHGSTSTGAPDPTTGQASVTGSSTEDITGTTGPACAQELCGEVCCLEGESCVDGACKPACGTGPFVPTLEWAWEVEEVAALPLVADLQGDDVPEVVVNAARVDGVARELGEIVLLRGDTGEQLWRIEHDPQNQRFGSHSLATPAIADVSGDARPDIIYAGRQDITKASRVHAVDGDGELLWTAHTAGDVPIELHWEHGAAVVANLDDDPQAEIAIGGVLIDHDGLLVWNQGGQGGLLGTPTNNAVPPKLLYAGGLPTFADLTGDGKPELVTGREAWTVNWTPGAPPTVSLTLLWKDTSGKGNDGWPAIADLDGNGTPEVVLVAWPDIKVLDGKTGELWCGVDPTGELCQGNEAMRTQPRSIKGGNLGGPATIDDFDGDGRPEVGIAGGVAYAVYDFNRPDETIIKPAADPPPAPGAMFVRWFNKTQDNSSAATGSSVFDFDGDGKAEVTYADECKLHVFDGGTGVQRFAVANSSVTVHEYPLVADVDGDGHAEFLAIANTIEAPALDGCMASDPDFQQRKGVFAYGSAASEWVPTRRLWTQHTYHVTDAQSDGTVPAQEDPNWAMPELNDFRRNVQGVCE